MTDQISIFELIANASVLVQAVMVILVLASVASWMMIFQRWFFLRAALAEINTFEEHFWSGIDLRKFSSELDQEENLNGIESVFVGGFREFTRLSDQAGADAEAIMQGVQRAMRVAVTREESRLETHLPFLATVGSTSPYVGLFGTVWGIMRSFTAIAAEQNSTLAVVAPGIAEALFATAIGLFAAIPAVIAYNRFAHRLNQHEAHLGRFADGFHATLSRELEKDV